MLDIAGSIDVQLKRVQSTAQSDPMGAAVAGQQNNAIVVEMTKKTGEKVEKEADDNVKSVSSSSSSLQSFKKVTSVCELFIFTTIISCSFSRTIVLNVVRTLLLCI